MRVTVVTHASPSPQALRDAPVLGFASALGSLADVEVLCGVYGGQDLSAIQDGVRLSHVGLAALERPGRPVPLRTVPEFYRALKDRIAGSERRPDVVHGYSGLVDALVACLLGRALKLPAVVTLQGDDSERQLSAPALGDVLASVLEYASAIVCVGETQRARLAERFPTLEAKLVTVANGHDPEVFSYRNHQEPRHFLFAGGLDPASEPERVLRAYAHIAEKTRFGLVMAGAGSLGTWLRRLSEELGVAERVVFSDPLRGARLAEALASAKAVIIPYRAASVPQLAIESLAAGTPLIVPAGSGAAELLKDGGGGVIAPNRSEVGMAEALLAASCGSWDPALVADSVPLLTWPECARLVVELYEQAEFAPAPSPLAEERRLAYLSLAPPHGGRERAHTFGIVQGLRERDWRVDVYEPERTSGSALARAGEQLRVLKRLLAEIPSTDALYCRADPRSIPAIVAAGFHGVPVVQEIPGDQDERGRLPVAEAARSGGLGYHLIKMQWQHAAALLANSTPLATWVRRHVEGVPVRVIPDAADITTFRPGAQAPPDLPARYVVFVGRLAAWEGVPTLIRALAHPAWPAGVELVMVGDGDEREAVEQAAVENDLPITMLGNVPYPMLPGVIGGAIAALRPQGSVDAAAPPRPLFGLYEALACNVPLVVTDCCGQAELVRGTCCGLVVPPWDAAALAEGVATLADDPERARRMGERGGAAVRRWHSWDSRAAETDDLLRSLTSEAAAPPEFSTAHAELRR